ncbi:hypothetical protein [Listeria monocytogenes]|uniref:hypothetical protein n=1 Tax=Listeria monocytogenes TaxID=1639 RepID=UPI00140304D0|nr:hypothetical protein [Listeria monocytogenes]
MRIQWITISNIIEGDYDFLDALKLNLEDEKSILPDSFMKKLEDIIRSSTYEARNKQMV